MGWDNMDTLALGVVIVFVAILVLAASNLPDQFSQVPTTLLYMIIGIIAIVPAYFALRD